MLILVILLVLILVISYMVLNMMWYMMLNMMWYVLNPAHNVCMMCIRLMNPLIYMVGGFVVYPNMGWLSGGLSGVVGWWFG